LPLVSARWTVEGRSRVVQGEPGHVHLGLAVEDSNAGALQEGARGDRVEDEVGDGELVREYRERLPHETPAPRGGSEPRQDEAVTPDARIPEDGRSPEEPLEQRVAVPVEGACGAGRDVAPPRRLALGEPDPQGEIRRLSGAPAGLAERDPVPLHREARDTTTKVGVEGAEFVGVG